MNEVETRTSQALHDVVDGLSVTDDDIARMEAELFTALAHPRRSVGLHVTSRRRRGLAVAAVAAAAAVVAGVVVMSGDEPEPPRPAGRPASDRPLVPADLVGTWQNVPGSPWIWEFGADGQFSSHLNAGDYLEGHQGGDRIVSRSGDVYTIASDPGCEETWRIRVVRPGAVALLPQRDSCESESESDSEGEAPGLDELLLERVSPRPYLAGELAAIPSPDSGGFVESSFMNGVWLHVGTGTILAVGNPGGDPVTRYLLDDDGDGATSPDQRGRVTISPDGSPVFRPDASAAQTCRLSFAPSVIDRAATTTTSAGGGCLAGPGPHTWVRIS